MGDRKVLNQYYPPDFDPSRLPRVKRAEGNMLKVRMMLPMSIQCGTCGTYMSKGTKFNTRKEDVPGETYLGIQVFRFTFRCSTCSAEIAFKTDPANTDYAVESGATRNFEPWRAREEAAAAAAAAKAAVEGGGDAMAALEARVAASRAEVEQLAALDEMRALAAVHERVGADAALAALKRAAAEDGDDGGGGDGGEDDDDDAAVAAMLAARAERVRRLEEDGAEEDGGGGGAGPGPSTVTAAVTAAPPPRRPAAAVVVRKRPAGGGGGDGGGPPPAKKAAADAPPLSPPPGDGEGGGLAGLLGGYGSGSSSG